MHLADMPPAGTRDVEQPPRLRVVPGANHWHLTVAVKRVAIVDNLMAASVAERVPVPAPHPRMIAGCGGPPGSANRSDAYESPRFLLDLATYRHAVAREMRATECLLTLRTAEGYENVARRITEILRSFDTEFATRP